MICKKCRKSIPDDSKFCCYCGKDPHTEKLKKPRNPKKRGNGQGSVYKQGDKYVAIVTLYCYLDPDTGKYKRKTLQKTFAKKSDAINALPEMKNSRSAAAKRNDYTFADLFNCFIIQHSAGKSTLDNYRAGFKHFYPVHDMFMSEITVDDLQQCINDCEKGIQTRKNMKTTAGLIYKYGIPRNCIPQNLNLGEYLKPGGGEVAHKEGFTELQLERIRQSIGKVPYADYIYCMCYLGFRPSEALDLKISSYDPVHQTLTGGAKTEAGKNRTVTISPKILKYIIKYSKHDKYIFENKNGDKFRLNDFREMFYASLEGCGIDNPVIVKNGMEYRTYTPHSCRHTFATLMKRVDGSSKDKLELIGHSSEAMLRYYQDVSVDDLKKITDAI